MSDICDCHGILQLNLEHCCCNVSIFPLCSSLKISLVGSEILNPSHFRATPPCPFFLAHPRNSRAESLHSLLRPKCPNCDSLANLLLTWSIRSQGHQRCCDRVSLCDLSANYLRGEALRTSTCHQGGVLFLGLTLNKHNPEVLATYTQRIQNCNDILTNHLHLCHSLEIRKALSQEINDKNSLVYSK